MIFFFFISKLVLERTFPNLKRDVCVFKAFLPSTRIVLGAQPVQGGKKNTKGGQIGKDAQLIQQSPV